MKLGKRKKDLGKQTNNLYELFFLKRKVSPKENIYESFGKQTNNLYIKD